MLTPDQERVKELLCETITLLCKNGLHFQDEFCIDGLIGITLDRRDVFLVTIKETVKCGDVFVRDRQHSMRAQAAEELPHAPVDSQSAAIISEGDSHSSETRSDLDSASRLQDTNLRESGKETATVSSPVAANDPGVCQMEIDERVWVKAEEGVGSRETADGSRATEKRQKPSRVVESISCHRQSSHNAESQTSPAAEIEKDPNSSIDRNQDDYLPIVPYSEMNSTVTCGDESKESPDLNSQLSIESSAQSQFSSTDRYYRAAPIGHNERKVASEGCDSGQNSNQKPDAESDGDELVVVKVEPPTSDYPDDQFSSSSSYRQTQANDVHGFASDSGYMYNNRIKDMAGYPVKHSHGMPQFDYAGQMAETSVHGSGYGQQFSQSFQMNRYQMKSGMNHSALPNDTSPSPHLSGHDKKQPNSLLPALTKPYRRMDCSKGTPERDLHQLPFPMPPMPDLNNSLLESESPMMQTDLEKYAEMQSFCMNRRARSTFTAYQLQRLESAFKCAHYVDASTRNQLAEELNLSDSIILVWFQNRRQKFKKQMKMSFS